MPLRYYEALQVVLSQTRDVICTSNRLTADEAFQAAEAFIQENSQKWRLETPGIRYEDPFCRMAYLYMNATIHATLVEHACKKYREISELIKGKISRGEDIHVCALGGGPGSELLGMVRFLESQGVHDQPAYLDFTLVDCVREWDESWHALKRGIDEQLRAEYGPRRMNWPAVISRSFLPLDVTRVSDFKDFATRFHSVDIFICCYLLSEIKGSVGLLEATLQLLVNRAPQGTLLLVIDRDERRVREDAEHVIRGIAALSDIGQNQERGKMESDVRDLGEWYMNIPSLPRQSWQSFFHLAKKTA